MGRNGEALLEEEPRNVEVGGSVARKGPQRWGPMIRIGGTQSE
jgi:hypothetical protein